MTSESEPASIVLRRNANTSLSWIVTVPVGGDHLAELRAAKDQAFAINDEIEEEARRRTQARKERKEAEKARKEAAK